MNLFEDEVIKEWLKKPTTETKKENKKETKKENKKVEEIVEIVVLKKIMLLKQRLLKQN